LINNLTNNTFASFFFSRKMTTLLLLFTLLSFSLIDVAFGATLVHYKWDSCCSTGGNFCCSADDEYFSLDTAVESSVISFPTVAGNTGVNRLAGEARFEILPQSVSSKAAALSQNCQFTVTVKMKSGTYISGNVGISFEVGKGGSSSPRGIVAKTSVDSFSSEVLSMTLGSTSLTLQSFSASLQAPTDTFSVKLYGYVPSSGICRTYVCFFLKKV
jgi:hypothetical protein